MNLEALGMIELAISEGLPIQTLDEDHGWVDVKEPEKIEWDSIHVLLNEFRIKPDEEEENA